jgi:hypothetical protein
VLVIQPAEGSQLMQGMVPTLDIQSVPEPGTIGLVLGGMVLMTLKRRRGR